MDKTIAIIGLGNRGVVYANFLKANGKLKIAAVCDTSPQQRGMAIETYGVKPSCIFADEESFFSKGKLADILLIATLDKLHYRQVMRGMEIGYDILVEKPVTPDATECKNIVNKANELGRRVVVCHNLRYTPFYSKMKQLIHSGIIGDVVDISQAENVGFGHYISSFNRGKWKISEETSPMILQKCCHDLDIIVWLMNKKAKAVSSFGGLEFYTNKCAPQKCADFCVDCKEKDCMYNAIDFYLRFPESLCVPYGFDATKENIIKYASDKNNQYARCVFRNDNDVVDRQTVNIVFEDGATASLLMHGFTQDTHRITKIYGTAGEIEGKLEKGIISVTQFGNETVVYDINREIDLTSGHSGGDKILIDDYVEYVLSGKMPLGLSKIEDSISSHLIAFASEKSRIENGSVVLVGEDK